MRPTIKILPALILALSGCVAQFIPEINENAEMMVVRGMITNLNNSYTVTITRSVPVTSEFSYVPVTGCTVTASDDNGGTFIFSEQLPGVYRSDSTVFTGIQGRTYTLHIYDGLHYYESEAMELIPVPEIDSLYAALEDDAAYTPGETKTGYRVYVSTSDPADQCEYYRWTFEETWEFELPFDFPTVTNRLCWKNAASENVIIRSASALAENRITGQPLTFLTTDTDRLMRKYSILAKQYSICESEFRYWEHVRKLTQEIGGLYDIIPSSVRSNLHCTDDPSIKVLGFFSTSAVTSKRIFLEYKNAKYPDLYTHCAVDTIHESLYSPALYPGYYIIRAFDTEETPRVFYYILTNKKACADCTMTGTNIMPDFWNQKGPQTIIHTLPDEQEE